MSGVAAVVCGYTRISNNLGAGSLVIYNIFMHYPSAIAILPFAPRFI